MLSEMGMPLRRVDHLVEQAVEGIRRSARRCRKTPFVQEQHARLIGKRRCRRWEAIQAISSRQRRAIASSAEQHRPMSSRGEDGAETRGAGRRSQARSSGSG